MKKMSIQTMQQVNGGGILGDLWEGFCYVTGGVLAVSGAILGGQGTPIGGLLFAGSYGWFSLSDCFN